MIFPFLLGNWEGILSEAKRTRDKIEEMIIESLKNVIPSLQADHELMDFAGVLGFVCKKMEECECDDGPVYQVDRQLADIITEVIPVLEARVWSDCCIPADMVPEIKEKLQKLWHGEQK